MRKILVLGAGKSAYHLIKYLLKHAGEQNWQITVADFSLENALEKTANHPAAIAIAFNADNEEQRKSEISKTDIVVSLLPPDLHFLIAKECLVLNKNLVTASYVSPQMKTLDNDVKKNGLIFLNECGLDPGIDHMSAMSLLDDLKETNAKITSFKSFTGGLVAPESNTNPWGYKFTWNPKNVITAGQGTACYRESGMNKYLPYTRLFKQTETIEIENVGSFEGYANRDSLKYSELYNLDSIPTILRGTLRYKGFCSAWNFFVQLGITDDSYKIADADKLTYAQWIKSYTKITKNKKLIDQLKTTFANQTFSKDDWGKIKWTGILEEKPIRLNDATPAEILLDLLLQKWQLEKNDLDMVVMQHIIEYQINNDAFKLKSSLTVKGENQKATAMSKTVGLPLAIAVKLILNKSISLQGVVIPIQSEIYKPILAELQQNEIHFTDTIVKIHN
jgi:saccharopine dehydrogenase (NADP+, L-glutamate forming)